MGHIYTATPGQNPGVARIYIYICCHIGFLLALVQWVWSWSGAFPASKRSSAVLVSSLDVPGEHCAVKQHTFTKVEPIKNHADMLLWACDMSIITSVTQSYSWLFPVVISLQFLTDAFFFPPFAFLYTHLALCPRVPSLYGNKADSIQCVQCDLLLHFQT